ncbi:Sapep family Mn(2+)-dependent dipeptidase [Leuconostoc gelidum subsp. aenigmaticum]|uniref:Sapep family Mn(2+)-dependent dipeptidase n=1 Tax=Leuconostoc gelidum TaxID=1244 RepID=UPI001CC3EB12|nr:Sapep family Mn(2+)-dependent dipeptidase [Leuconostoc gelidum]MBZ6008302.1 Sapep family Mn(2+)-dependent dipeptidase [Leuconostoc gelidum subsp. aenigmaticum]
MRKEYWQEVSQKHYNQWASDLMSLIRIPSIKTEDTASIDEPYGAAVKQALQQMLLFAKRDGLVYGCVANRVGYIEYGPQNADKTVGILTHVDVVPTGEGWESNPFEPIIKGNDMIGRGVDDMKASTMLSYYALILIAEKGLIVKNKIRLIIGTDEENDWSDMPYYFDKEGVPELGFSPDGEFIVENAEAGIANVMVTFAASNASDVRLLTFDAGIAGNVVPGVATALVSGIDVVELKMALHSFLSETQQKYISANITDFNDKVEIKLIGRQAHGSTPEVGKNAGTYLANFLTIFNFSGQAKNYLTILGHVAHLDSFGEKMGLAYDNKDMGPLVVNYGLQHFEDADSGYFSINIRYPFGITQGDITAIISNRVAALNANIITDNDDLQPHLTPENDAVITTLLSVYQDIMGKPTRLHYSTGASFGRLIQRGAAFGSRFEWQKTTAHQINESYDLNNYPTAIAILAESMYRLGNVK